jgi:hypothetical protein
VKAWLISTVCCTLACAGAPTAEDKLTAEDRRCLAWFDTLGFPDLGKCKLVKVATGETIGDEHGENTYLHAMLLRDEGPQFMVFTFLLEKKTYRKTPPGTPEYARVGYEVQDLAKEADSVFKARPEGGGYQFPLDHGGTDYGDRTGHWLVIARACAGHGQESMAHRILQLADELRHDERPKSLCESFADNFARVLTWQALEEFAKPSVTRKQILARFEWLLRTFARTDEAENIRETASLLRKMVAEDEEHDHRPHRAAKEMTKSERVAELIYQLRNQRGDGDEIYTEYFMPDHSPGNPISGVLDAGYDTVPQLIDALNDNRFTRWAMSSQGDPPTVIRVRECALNALSALSGKAFWNGQKFPHPDEAIKDWWRDIQSHSGPDQMTPAKARAIAIKEVEKREGWQGEAEPAVRYETLWVVNVWRLPRVPGGFRNLRIGDDGKVRSYNRGK